MISINNNQQQQPFIIKEHNNSDNFFTRPIVLPQPRPCRRGKVAQHQYNEELTNFNDLINKVSTATNCLVVTHGFIHYTEPLGVGVGEYDDTLSQADQMYLTSIRIDHSLSNKTKHLTDTLNNWGVWANGKERDRLSAHLVIFFNYAADILITQDTYSMYRSFIYASNISFNISDAPLNNTLFDLFNKSPGTELLPRDDDLLDQFNCSNRI
ncbi:hypothetical protein DFA_05011 [Cavenderia fasciculata]|uniref:Uncharacterized protein n=1 Tax=Cavenderia fasciculata TaxID=261658 RepID=F4PMY8_CACFS|nr:uncharacterized protein DFA_05011 [Cavenderia fasciculata]EGG22881.1 hypothetical protein DFA_05011 [Cavenderia fasciculata]|eukprot:XP_004360732.1 hypothetical protein DFA_05011 [Cavenderia fasciculata]